MPFWTRRLQESSDNTLLKSQLRSCWTCHVSSGISAFMNFLCSTTTLKSYHIVVFIFLWYQSYLSQVPKHILSEEPSNEIFFDLLWCQSDLLRSQLSGDTSFLNVYFTKLIYFRKEAVTIQVWLFLRFWLKFLQSCLSIFTSSSSYLLRNQCLHCGQLGVCKRRVKDNDICQVRSGSRC